MTETKGLVPITVARAAHEVLEYLEQGEELVEESFRARLRMLMDAPHWLPVEDPLVYVSWSLVHTEARIPLHLYLACCAQKAVLSFSIGKHNDVEVDANDFNARFSYDGEAEERDEDCPAPFDCEEEWADALDSCDYRKELLKVAADRVKELGPFLPTSPFDFEAAIEWIREKTPQGTKKRKSE